MDELIKLIQEKIDELEEEMYDLSELMENEVAKARLLKDVKENPDSIDEATFRPLFSGDLSSTIDEILSYKGWFSESANESQIIAAKTKLDELIAKKMKEYEDRYVAIRENDIKPKDEVAKKYKETLKIITDYNNEKYITPEELKQLDELMTLVGNPDEAVNLYIEIAINNLKNANKLTKETKVEAPKEEKEYDLKEIDEAYESANITVEDVQEKKSEREIVIERLNKFLNVERKEKPSYVDVKKQIGPKLYSITKQIINDIKVLVDKKVKDEYAIDFKLVKDYIRLSNGFDLELEKDFYNAIILVELLEAYETKNVQKIQKAIKKYREKLAVEEEKAKARAAEEARIMEELEAEEAESIRKREAKKAAELKFEQEFNQALLEEEKAKEKSLDDFKPAEGLEEFALFLKEVNDKYQVRDYIESNKDSLLSLDGLSDAEIKAVLTFEEEYYKYCISNCYAKMLNVLLEHDNSPETIKRLEELKIEVLLATTNYDNYINSMRTTLDELRDSGEPFNYLVIFDQDEFDERYKKEFNSSPLSKTQYPKEVLRCLTELINETNLTEAKPKFHNIHEGDGSPNEEEICDYPCKSSHKMRLTVKVFEDPHVKADGEGNKHNVIIVFTNVYARKEKSDELMDTLTIFERNPERYKELQRIFGPNGTREEQEREFARAFALVDELKKKTKTLKGD